MILSIDKCNEYTKFNVVNILKNNNYKKIRKKSYLIFIIFTTYIYIYMKIIEIDKE